MTLTHDQVVDKLDDLVNKAVSLVDEKEDKMEEGELERPKKYLEEFVDNVKDIAEEIKDLKGDAEEADHQAIDDAVGFPFFYSLFLLAVKYGMFGWLVANELVSSTRTSKECTRNRRGTWRACRPILRCKSAGVKLRRWTGLGRVVQSGHGGSVLCGLVASSQLFLSSWAQRILMGVWRYVAACTRISWTGWIEDNKRGCFVSTWDSVSFAQLHFL